MPCADCYTNSRLQRTSASKFPCLFDKGSLFLYKVKPPSTIFLSISLCKMVTQYHDPNQVGYLTNKPRSLSFTSQPFTESWFQTATKKQTQNAVESWFRQGSQTQLEVEPPHPNKDKFRQHSSPSILAEAHLSKDKSRQHSSPSILTETHPNRDKSRQYSSGILTETHTSKDKSRQHSSPSILTETHPNRDKPRQYSSSLLTEPHPRPRFYSVSAAQVLTATQLRSKPLPPVPILTPHSTPILVPILTPVTSRFGGFSCALTQDPDLDDWDPLESIHLFGKRHGFIVQV